MGNRIIKDEKGTCPFCDTDSYTRDSLELEDDYAFCSCDCQNCGKSFIEVFKLVKQTWRS